MFDGATTTPAQTAAAVRRPAAQQAAEHQLAGLKRRVDEIGDEIRRLNHRKTDLTSAAINSRLVELDLEQREARHRVTGLRPKVTAGRREHAAKLHKAFTPSIAEIAAKGHDAASALANCIAQLAEVNRVLSAAGGDIIWMPMDNGLETMTTRLARLRDTR